MKFYSNIVLVFLVFLVSSFSYGQQNEELISYANDLKLSNPEEAIRISENILQRLNNETPKNYEVYIVLIETSFYLEWYDKAIEYILKYREFNYDIPIGVQFDIALIEAIIYSKIGISNYKDEAMKNAYSLINRVKEEKTKDLFQWKLKMQNSLDNEFGALQKSDSIKFDSLLSDNITDNDRISEFQKLDHLVLKGIKSRKKHDFESDLKQLLPFDKNTYERLYYENYSLVDAHYYSSIKEHSTAIQILRSTLDYLDSYESHFYYKNKVIEMLINNLIELKDKTGLLDARKISRNIENQILRVETSVINKLFEYTSRKNKEDVLKLEQKQSRIINTFLIVSMTVLLITALLWFRYHWQYKQYAEVHQYLEKLDKKPKAIESKSKVVSKISDELESQILKGLESFEMSNEFLNNNVSLAYLASKLEVNTKYLSSFLNTELQESFSAYINRLRIEYIVGKLKKDPKYLKYKISYLAETAGYSSHSSFSIAFKAVTGKSPSSFINYLKK